MAFTLNQITKIIRETYIPGSPGVSADPGQLFVPAYCETVEVVVQNSGPEFSGGGGGEDPVYGCVQLPVLTPVYNSQGEILRYDTTYEWVCYGGDVVGDDAGGFNSPNDTSTDSVQVCYPEQPYIPPTEPIQASESQIITDFNLGWNAGGIGDVQVLPGNAFQFSIQLAALGAAAGVSSVFKLPDPGYSGMDLCVMAVKGKFAILKDGVTVVGYQPFADGDVFRINHTNAGKLSVFRNTEFLYETDALAPAYNADVSLYAGGDYVYDGSIETITVGTRSGDSSSTFSADAVAHVPDFGIADSSSLFTGDTGAVEVDGAVITTATSYSTFSADAVTATTTQAISYSTFGTDGVANPASGSISFADNPTEGDTITIDGVVYEFTATPTSETDILIGATLDETLENAADVINAYDDARDNTITVVADLANDTLIITATEPGTAGNSIDIAASSDTASGSTLTGGTDGTESSATASIGTEGYLTFEPLAGAASGPGVHTGTASLVFEPLELEANSDMVAPAFGLASMSFVPMIMYGHMLIGSVGDASLSFEPMDMIASEGSYGSGEMAFEPLDGIGIEVPEFDMALVADLPGLTFEGWMYESDKTVVNEKLPALAFQGQFGSQLDADLPGLTFQGSVTNENILRVNKSLPALTFEGQMFAGSNANLARKLPALTFTGWFGAQLKATLPRLTGSGFIQAGNVLTLNARLPAITLEAVISQDNVLRLDADLPGLQPLYGILVAQLPALTFVGSMNNYPATVYDAYAMNIGNNAMTQYVNYGFDYIVRFEGNHYGVNSDGIRLLGGADDDQVNINWSFTIPPTDFGYSQEKRMPYVYLGASINDAVIVRAIVDEARMVTVTTQHAGRNRRAKIPKGLKGRFWEVSIMNRNGQDGKVDSLELLPDITRRKV